MQYARPVGQSCVHSLQLQSAAQSAVRSPQQQHVSRSRYLLTYLG